MTTLETVKKIMQEIVPTKDLTEVQDIVEGAYIDSFELMALITALGESFGIEVGIDDIVPENFNSLEAIARMADRLRG